MPSNIYYSNKLEELVKTLGVKIKQSPCGIFTKEYIITQTAGMKQWLAVEMAKKENNGVFANFALENQDAFLNELYTLLTSVQVQRNSETGKWILFELLGSEEFNGIKEFNSVTEYYKNDDLKRIQLAAQLVDLFDQYQIYSEEMVDNWNNNIFHYPDNANERWQQWLWGKLNAQSELFFPKTRIKKEIFAALKNEEKIKLVQAKFPVINFFGNTVYTSYHLDIFKVLAGIIEINHFIMLPLKEVSNTKEYKNELFVSLGNKSREIISMMDLAGSVSNSIEPSQDSLLHKIQHQIFHDTPVTSVEKITKEILNDNSILINSAYTEAREVEMLYNYLVDLKANKAKDLRPQEILVLTTDIDIYAPYIKAVFKNGTYKIPYKISGVSAGQKESIITALVKILDFEESDFTSEKVVSLLATKSIAARFGITDTANIRDKVGKANIRFGRKGRSVDDTQYVSWEYGMKKLVYGYAMLTEESYEVPCEAVSIYPFEDIEEKTGRDIFRLKAFVDALEKIIDTKNELKNLAEWRKFIIEEVLDKMIFVENADKPDLSVIFQQLNNLKDAEAKMAHPLKFRVFFHGIKKALTEESGELGFNSGKVTFSSHIPARGIPCKVIAFLGLNSNKFPGKDKFAGFDLIAKETLLGDRSKKNNDKQLFLDTILSAREYLYFSYIGRSVKDNSSLPPSIILDQLMDYLESIAVNPSQIRGELLVEHPLHGFSGRYQKENPRLYSYLYGTGNAVEFPEKTLEADDSVETEININQLIKFFEHPIKYYYEKVLGVDFDEIEGPLEETELFELDHLIEWEMKKELVEYQQDNNSFLEKAKKDGKLQLANSGLLELEKINESVADLKVCYKAAITGKLRSKQLINYTVSIPLDDNQFKNVTLVGNIDNIFDENELIIYSVSKNYKHKDSIRAKLKHLLLSASGHSVTTTNLKLQGELVLEKRNPEDASKIIQKAVRIFLDASKIIFLFEEDALPKIKNLLAEEGKEDGDQIKIEKLITEIHSVIKTKAYPGNFGFADNYIKQAYDDKFFSDGLVKLKEDYLKMIQITED